MTVVCTDFFDGKCDAYIEGYRFVPNGETWTHPDGTVFRGEMITPWKPFDELDLAQREHERQLLAEYEAELTELRENSIPAADLEAAYQEGVDSAYDQ
jgi:hypothetical protein